MSWVRVDDKFWCHPKTATLSAGALRLWLFALCWSAQHEQDGAVPRAVLASLRGTPKLAQELVSAGLWEEESQAVWRIHDFLEYQPSREQRKAQRAAVRTRVGRYRGSGNGDCNAVTDSVTEGVTNADVTASARAPAPTRARTGRDQDLRSPEGDTGETPCPPGLVAELTTLGVVSELAKACGVPESSVTAALDEFVGYWTIGAGAGDRRRHWPKRARERVRELHREGKLSCAAPAALSGAAADRARTEAEKRNQADARRRQRELAELYPEVTGADLDAARRALGVS